MSASRVVPAPRSGAPFPSKSSESGMNIADAPAPPAASVHAAGPAGSPAGAPALRADGLGKRVALPSGGLTILDGVTFEVARGEVVAVVGASGSGKST